MLQGIDLKKKNLLSIAQSQEIDVLFVHDQIL